MSNFFGYVNEVGSHSKSRQSDLALEKSWVALFGWLRLCTTGTVGMNITDFWRLFLYGIKRDHYEKLIGIREFLEWLALYCFNNPFSTDTGAPKKKPFLDEVDDEETVSTFHALHFSSSDLSFHRGHQYFQPHSQHSFIDSLYFGRFYYCFSVYWWKRRSEGESKV